MQALGQQLYKSQTTIPLAGLGLYKVATAEVMQKLLQEALDVGYRHFDTAIMYGNEKLIGEAFQNIWALGKYKRSDIFLTSKFFPYKEKNVIDQLKQSLADLQTEYLDLWLLHWPAIGPGENDVIQHKPVHQSWREMEECVDQGLAKNIGVSNFNVQSLIDLLAYCKHWPTVNQVELHLYLQQPRLLKFCERFHVRVTAYCPIARAGALLNDPVLVELAQKYNKTPVQVALHHLAVRLHASVIPKTEKVERLRENFEWRDFTLTEDEYKRLEGLDRNERIVDPAERDWLGYLALFN